MRKKIGCNIPVSFRGKDEKLLEWVYGQASKRYLKLGSFSAVIRRCIEIVRDKNLLTEGGQDVTSSRT